MTENFFKRTMALRRSAGNQATWQGSALTASLPLTFPLLRIPNLNQNVNYPPFNVKMYICSYAVHVDICGPVTVSSSGGSLRAYCGVGRTLLSTEAGSTWSQPDPSLEAAVCLDTWHCLTTKTIFFPASVQITPNVTMFTFDFDIHLDEWIHPGQGIDLSLRMIQNPICLISPDPTVFYSSIFAYKLA